jgi:integrase
MRYHDLRHGAVSLMAAQGVSPRVAMEIFGHAQISTMMKI